ncbi:hypothetical protein BYT27DRAFT_7339251 [Phlegmacium glaucopus]|nr:hypothetical protein BYT27DRAFT_7339251 [Phlegmacium glaucopus]
MAASEPSPVSDESSSEGPHLRELVNETINHDQPTAMSPRSALLAHTHTSLGEHPAAEPVRTIIEPSRTRRRTSASERRRKRERDLANASPSQRELVRLLFDQEQEVSVLRKQLYIANQRVESEARRAAELEQENQLVAKRYHEINESKVVVQQEASKAIQDSRLYHLELENAQKEIERARESLKRIERERDEAEAAAARARTKTRQLRQQQMVAAAREDGRRLGFEAGFEHARQERLATGSRRPHSSASRRNPPSSSRDVVNSPPKDPSYQPSMRSHTSQEENEEALRSSSPLDDDLDTSPKPLSDLQIPNLPPVDPSVNSPTISAKQPRTSPLRPFQPPPESTHGSEHHTPRLLTPSNPVQEAPLLLADRSPSVQYYEIEIPPQDLLTREEIMREFNTKENPNDIVKQMPRDTWVTAEKHHEMRGFPPAPYPGPNPPPLLPTPQPQPQPKKVRLAKSPLKVVRLPTLAKTRQQAASWYRSFSFRKKNKPVIDPTDELDTPVKNQETTTPTSAATNNKGKGPEPSTASTQASDSDSQYGAPSQPPQSWYKKSAPSSVRTAGSKRRPASGVESSPGLSQFELLFTPHVGTYSVRSGKEGKKPKEKDNLSVINEERMSQGNTPTTDRFLTSGMGASSSRMASSIASTTGVQQRPSYEALGSKTAPLKLRHPLAIVVPNPDEPLPPAGVAYSQAGPSNSRPHDYSLAHMAHKASRSLGRRTTPSNDSIGIEVVPPSGIAPDPVPSPPHSGQNHLSPYHVYRPTSRSSSRIIPAQSITSLISSGGNHPELPPPTGLRSGSRASSRQSDNKGLGPTLPSSPVSRPRSAMNATPFGNPTSNKSVEDARSSHSRTPRARTPMMMPPRETQTSPNPQSVRSSASKKPSARNLSTSQTNLVVEQQQPHLQPSTSASNLVSPLRHSPSRVSLREAGSFSNGFDDGTYLDPAFYPGDKPSDHFIQQPSMARGDHRSQTSLNVHSRPVSRGTSSALSYV